jgi:hypothetical protein
VWTSAHAGQQRDARTRRRDAVTHKDAASPASLHACLAWKPASSFSFLSALGTPTRAWRCAAHAGSFERGFVANKCRLRRLGHQRFTPQAPNRAWTHIVHAQPKRVTEPLRDLEERAVRAHLDVRTKLRSPPRSAARR